MSQITWTVTPAGARFKVKGTRNDKDKGWHETYARTVADKGSIATAKSRIMAFFKTCDKQDAGQ